jgi:hypothetical protein
MIRAQRRAHLWIWLIAAVALIATSAAALLARNAVDAARAAAEETR